MRNAILLLVVLAGCTGRILDDRSDPGDPGDTGVTPPTGDPTPGPVDQPGAPFTAFACDASALPAAQPWRKLTAVQYRNTLSDLLAFGLRDADLGRAVMGDLGGALARLPPDERQKLPQDLHGSFRRLDQAVEQSQVETTYDLAVAVGAALAQRPGNLLGPCAVDADAGNDDACLTAFIERFGSRALRRPLDAAEVALYQGVHGAGPIAAAGVADVVAALLTAPQFLYHVEHGDAPVPGLADVYTLAAFELANRLSYHFWNTMPDAALWDAAAAGRLADPAELGRQVDRLLGDPRARATFDEFFRDWLKLDDVPPLDTRGGERLYRAFAGDDLPQGTLRGAMLDDVLDLARDTAWDNPGGGRFDDLLLSERSFARTPDLAKIYGVATWEPGQAPPMFPAGLRRGLLTRAALLANGSAQTRPIMKGVFAREAILCDELPAPPDNAAANMAALSPTLSTRQVVEALTETRGTACAACHATYINAIGFATEGFDALGRVRVEQPLYSDDGSELARVPVDTASVPQIIAGDLTPVSGPRALMDQILSSGKAHACFVRNYFRYTFARWDNLSSDGCALESLRQALRARTGSGGGGDAGSIRGMFRQVALLPAFAQRRF